MATDKQHTTLNVPTLRFPEFSGEWKKSTIGSEFDLYSGNTPSRMNKAQFEGDINWVTSGELKEHYIAKTKECISKDAAISNNLRLLPAGTFVIAIYGLEADGVRGTCSITSQTATISQACMAFLPKNVISTEFLYSWYKKHGNIIGIKYAQGTKQQNLSYDIVSQFRIDYPTLSEQNKLSIFIRLLDERIATQKKVIEKLQSLIGGIYKSIFADIDCSFRLDEICEIRKGQQVNGTELFEDGEYYVMNGGVEPSGCYDKFNTPANTISISEGGNSCGYVQFNNRPFWSGGHCYTLRNVNLQYNLRFLYHYLKANESEIMKLRIGSGLPNIQKKDLASYCVPAIEMKEQIKIAQLLNSIQSRIDISCELLDSYERQKTYLLSTMFI